MVSPTLNLFKESQKYIDPIPLVQYEPGKAIALYRVSEKLYKFASLIINPFLIGKSALHPTKNTKHTINNSFFILT